MSLDIIVCTKLVPDPEGPPASFQVNEYENTMTVKGIPPVINPFDENALEAAMRIKETHGAKVTLLSMGKKLSRAVILKAIATGVDEAILIEETEFDAVLLDSYSSAKILAAAIRKIGKYDLILTGRQASDTNSGQVGLGIASILSIPSITLAQKVEIEGDRVVVERVLPNGYEVQKTGTPALVTVSSEVGDLRYAGLAAIRSAKSTPQILFDASDLGFDTPPSPKVRTISMAIPTRERSCNIIGGETPAEKGENLANELWVCKIV